MGLQGRACDVIDKLALDGKRPSTELDFSLTILTYRAQVMPQIMQHMLRFGRRADGNHGASLRHLSRRGQHRRTTERVSDQQLRRFMLLTEKLDRLQQVLYV